MASTITLVTIEEVASMDAQEDSEDLAAIRDWEAREAAGTTKYYSMSEVRRRLGLER